MILLIWMIPDVPQNIKDNIEFTIDMSDPKSHKLNVEVKPNMTRAAEQKTIERPNFER